ncbi:MAG: DUF2231 domain-containing protein [Ilumatobacteraceae bacterium]
MELEKIAGLPAHPLFVHVPVVLIPLAGILAIIFAVRPAWLDRFGWGLVGLSGVGMLGAILAAGSGEALEEMLEDKGEVISKSLKKHAEMGETARTVAIVFFLIVLAVVLVRSMAKKRAEGSGVSKFVASKGGAVAMSVLLALSAAGATYATATAGHSGAEEVWKEEFGNTGGDYYEEEDEDGIILQDAGTTPADAAG